MPCYRRVLAVLAVVVGAVKAETTAAHGYMSITNEATTDVSLFITGIASQTANFITVQDSGATDMFTVDVAGNVYSATNSYTSDGRWKHEVRNLTYGLETIDKLVPVGFEWIASHPASRAGRQLGFIAQDVENLIPEIVRTDAQGYKSLIYDRFAVISIKALQDLHGLVRAQAAAITRLEQAMADLQVRVSTLSGCC